MEQSRQSAGTAPAARPREANLTTILYRSLIASIGLAGALTIATFWLAARSQSENEWISHSLAVRDDAARVLGFVQSAETSQRGYLLTGRDVYLVPFADAASEIDKSLDRLAGLVAADPPRRAEIERMRQLSQEKLKELQDTIEARKTGNAEAALAIVNSDAGLRLMNDLRQAASDIIAHENQNLAKRRTSSGAFADLLELGAAAAFLALCAVGALMTFLTRRSFAEIEAARARLEAANHALLAEISQREKAESQLRQSQKMEAIGQLTGGIAHDFNNMLGVVTGNLDLLKRRIERGDFAIERFVEGASKATGRAAGLTHRLLAFARQQPLAPEPLNANKMIADMSELLRSTLGEHIQIETVTSAGLWMTHADIHQLESAVLNIAINARDAMPDGGKLTIETANAFLDEAYCRAHEEIEPGQFVMVAVSDTGVGMTPEVAARVFDPFFTTKPVGAGTGLGLSQVYGFVKQSKGHVKIYSEAGAGTTVKIYLPRLIEGALSAKEPSSTPLRRGVASERILVVEDDPSMRRIVSESARELGYTVLESGGAADALAVLAEEKVTLLLTDIVMPEIDGKKLADAAILLQPSLKVLYMTGYTRNAVVHGGVLDAGVQFMNKPFTLDQLAAKLRSVLDE
jgi:signal transduction histidine kinase